VSAPNEHDGEHPEHATAQEESAAALDYVQFSREHRPLLLQYARRIADDPQLGEDAVQEALIEAHAQWARVSIMERPLGWVLKVARRRLFQLRLGRQRVREVRLTVEDRATADIAETFVEEAAFWDAVRRLPPRQREIVSLRVGLHLKIGEIAELLGIKESTVRGNLARARARLRSLLEDAGHQR
jgi:RNA polymerase sigma factor (sigma-70 family)